MSLFLHMCTYVIPHIFLPSRETLYPVRTADRIPGLGSVVLWLSRWGVVNIFSSNINPIKGCLHWRSSCIKGRLPLKFVFLQRCLPSKVIFHQKSSSVKGRLPSKVVFSQRLSSIKGRLTFCCIKCAIQCSWMLLYHLLLCKPLYS